ncbi:hypothetical protein SADUNF_Sadunf02G0116900 [Salix dunnii]|uniref:Pentatricopeptide repeat-containing protein n=1 Tax=Salix dunnii TaxID=1413687 RepID=A0A835N7D2_9ROSI|nr:hypothetical protein SADUNF_Sadunf02G0116900 [Salix dunnii]
MLDSGWLAARSTEVNLSGTQFITTHCPTSPNKAWMEVVVPGISINPVLEPILTLKGLTMLLIYSTIITCAKKCNKFLSLYKRGVASGWKPNPITFFVLAKMLGEAGDYDGIRYVLLN